MNAGPCRQRGRTAWMVVGLALALCVTAAAQDAEAVRAMKKLHEELCRPGRVISPADGQDALAKLKQWNLTPEGLNEKDRGALLSTEMYAALAVGDAVRAAEELGALEALAADARETAEAAYLVGAARGDADACQAALKKLADVVPADERALIQQRRRWVKHVGSDAPSLTITAESGTKVAVKERKGSVLVIDFWNRRDTTKDYAKALKDLYTTLKSEKRVQFLGVNSDGQADADAARQFASAAGYSWPQHYEEKAGRGPITYDAFGAGLPPWTVVIDGKGRIRAVGAVTEPALQYALRTATSEATGQFAGGKGSEAAAGQPGQARPGKGDLPSNDEAEAMLRQARAYIQTGMKTKARELLEEIIRRFPGTRQAREAEERLEDLK
jgi:hypothetical protein